MTTETRSTTDGTMIYDAGSHRAYVRHDRKRTSTRQNRNNERWNCRYNGDNHNGNCYR